MKQLEIKTYQIKTLGKMIIKYIEEELCEPHFEMGDIFKSITKEDRKALETWKEIDGSEFRVN